MAIRRKIASLVRCDRLAHRDYEFYSNLEQEMSDKVCIGRCSICGGRVMQYTVLWIVGPWPPARCESCGAIEDVPEKVIPMRPTERRKQINPYIYPNTKWDRDWQYNGRDGSDDYNQRW